jgi:fibro-slime domain-containing protein
MRQKLISAISCGLGLILALSSSVVRAEAITLTGTVRDFNSCNTTFNGVAGHPDFECKSGDDRGIVAATLGADGKPVFAGGNHPTVTSAASFYQWYHDDPTVNMSGSVSITLNKINATQYQFSSNAFFPIDGLLLGQTACCGHNYGFTTEFHTSFTYVAGNDDNFEFSGDDDVFVYINGQLAIDLGGVHGAEAASVNLNSFAAAHGLLSGQDYTLDVFQAERHTTGSNFTMTTSLQLVPVSDVPEPSSWALAGIALVGVAATRRREGRSRV